MALHYDDSPMSPTPKYTPCKTCKHAHGKSLFDDAPDKRYCTVYRRDDGIPKPKAVYFDGEQCSFYERG